MSQSWIKKNSINTTGRFDTKRGKKHLCMAKTQDNPKLDSDNILFELPESECCNLRQRCFWQNSFQRRDNCFICVPTLLCATSDNSSDAHNTQNDHFGVSDKSSDICCKTPSPMKLILRVCLVYSDSCWSGCGNNEKQANWKVAVFWKPASVFGFQLVHFCSGTICLPFRWICQPSWAQWKKRAGKYGKCAWQ